MCLHDLTNGAPLWLLGLLMLLLLAGMCEVGIRLRALRPAAGARADAEGYLLSAALVLLALLIAFTFSLALNRYDTRRERVIVEANAIGTAWLRAGLIEGDAGTHLRQSIARYTDIRLRLAAPESVQTTEAETATGATQAALWAEMTPLARAAPPAIGSTLIAAMNDMFDIASARKAERDARIPARVFEVLLLYAAMSSLFVGFVLGATHRVYRALATILFALLSLALVLIVDLDRPMRGSITVSQAPMLAVRASMR